MRTNFNYQCQLSIKRRNKMEMCFCMFHLRITCLKESATTNNVTASRHIRALSALFTVCADIALERGSDMYSAMHYFVTEMCTHVHISVIKWCIVGYGTGALQDLCKRSMIVCVPLYQSIIELYRCEKTSPPVTKKPKGCRPPESRHLSNIIDLIVATGY